MKKLTSAELIAEVVKAGKITENEIKLILRRMNGGEKIDLSAIWDGEIKLTPDQNVKGITWLRNQWKSPRGAERKNNPFGYREQRALETFTDFTFAGVYDIGSYGNPFYVPLYDCNGTDGSFQYHLNNGQIRIVG